MSQLVASDHRVEAPVIAPDRMRRIGTEQPADEITVFVDQVEEIAVVDHFRSPDEQRARRRQPRRQRAGLLVAGSRSRLL